MLVSTQRKRVHILVEKNKNIYLENCFIILYSIKNYNIVKYSILWYLIITTLNIIIMENSYIINNVLLIYTYQSKVLTLKIFKLSYNIG